MRRGLAVFAALACLAIGPVQGQDQRVETAEAPGAMLRGLDRVSGTTTDLALKTGETGSLGWLQITLGDCRYPTGNPSGDAYAWLVIREHNNEIPLFEGWMIASSPALDALDHPRFDVWVIRCTTD